MVAQVELVPGSVRKICQLTGERDRQRNAYTLNRTETRFGLVGTDLGSSFEHDGRLWFLFGDTWPDAEGGDSVAWTTDRTPEPGIALQFVSADSRFVRPRVSTVDGRSVSTSFFEVPLDGFSAGGHMYVCRTTEHYREVGRQVMGRSLLTRAVNGDPTDLVCLYDLSIARRDGGAAVPRAGVAGVGQRPVPRERRLPRLRPARRRRGQGRLVVLVRVRAPVAAADVVRGGE